MVELVDTLVLETNSRNAVQVQVLLATRAFLGSSTKLISSLDGRVCA